MKRKVKGIGMISGGLDSLLAVAVLRQQEIEVKGLHFLNGYSPRNLKKRVYELMPVEKIAEEKKAVLSEALGIDVDVVDVSEEFLEVMKDPPHGFGKNVNPCIDCRIFLLRKARERMEKEGADFIFTGEVLGQRPMSQHLRAMKSVEKESGLQGVLLRPLCAKLLTPTKVETDGLVDREMLLDIQGRSRKRQMQLADELEVRGYGTPAGGCALTDINYAKKYIDLVGNIDRDITVRDIVLISTGRHLRISPEFKVVVGRNREENEYIEAEWADHYLATTPDQPGPTVVLFGEPTEENLLIAARITARYSDGKSQSEVRVMISRGEEVTDLTASPLPDEDLEKWRL